MSDRAWQVLVTAVVGLALLVVLRVVLGWSFDRYVKRVAARKPPDYVARLRTRLVVLRRVILAFVLIVVLWSVLEIFPTTEQLARTLLASGAFIALVLGVAFSVPLGNIGAGILLSLSQPVRIGDRITVGDVTGTAEEITLIHTIVRTDQGLTAFVPNSQMITSTVVNRTLDDPRRLVTVRLPVAITAPVEDARRVLLRTIGELTEPELEDASVSVIDVGEKTTWLAVTGYAPRRAAVDRAAAELRERGLQALARGGLPAAVGILASCAESASRPAPQARSTSATRSPQRPTAHSATGSCCGSTTPDAIAHRGARRARHPPRSRMAGHRLGRRPRAAERAPGSLPRSRGEARRRPFREDHAAAARRHRDVPPGFRRRRHRARDHARHSRLRPSSERGSSTGS